MLPRVFQISAQSNNSNNNNNKRSNKGRRAVDVAATAAALDGGSQKTLYSSQPDLSVLGLSPATGLESSQFKSTRVGSDAAGGSDWSVIRVWRSSDGGKEQCSKLVLLPSHLTTAAEAVRLAADEFGLPDEESEMYSLYHVSRPPLIY